MGFMTQSTSYYVPTFRVNINGKNVSHLIKEITINEQKDSISEFTLSIAVGYDRDKGEFQELDNPSFSAGNKVEIYLSYEEGKKTIPIPSKKKDKEKPIIKGYIIEVKASFFSGNAPTLSIRGFNGCCQLMQKTFVEFRKPFKKDKTYIQIVKDIAEKMSIEIELGRSMEKPKNDIFKDNETTFYDFIKSLANEIKFEVQVNRDGSIYFGEKRDQEKEVTTLTWEKDLINFNPTMNISEIVSAVEVRSDNIKDPANPIIGISSNQEFQNNDKDEKQANVLAKSICKNTLKVVRDNTLKDIMQADKKAQEILDKDSKTLIKGSGECIGNPIIEAMRVVKLENLGVRFSGKYYIDSVTHTFNANGYKTTFSVEKQSIGMVKDKK